MPRKRPPAPEPEPTPAPTPEAAPVSPSAKRVWPAPTMVDPKWVTVSGSSYGAKLIINGDGRDLWIKFGGPVYRRLYVRNAHNVRILGGEVNINQAWTYDYGDGKVYKDDRMAFMFDGITGEVDIEGVRMHGTHIIEGVNFGRWSSMPTAYPTKVKIQNCRIEGLHTPDAEWHPDCVQVWGGVGELLMYNVTMESQFQCFMAKANFNRLRLVDMRRVNMRGLDTQMAYMLNHQHAVNTDGQLMCETIAYGGDGSVAQRVLARRPQASTGGDFGHADFGKIATPNAYNTTANKAVLQAEADGRKFLSWPTAMKPIVSGRVYEHLAGEPDYVSATAVGMAYQP